MRRLTRMASWLVLLTILAAAEGAMATPVASARGANRARSTTITVGAIADQLGVSIAANAQQEFTVGINFTGTLKDPEKLAAFGIKDMHQGARVTAVRMATERVYVEADEMEPPHRASVRLRLDADGNLVTPTP